MKINYYKYCNQLYFKISYTFCNWFAVTSYKCHSVTYQRYVYLVIYQQLQGCMNKFGRSEYGQFYAPCVKYSRPTRWFIDPLGPGRLVFCVRWVAVQFLLFLFIKLGYLVFKSFYCFNGTLIKVRKFKYLNRL